MIKFNRIGNKLGLAGAVGILLAAGMVANQMISEAAIEATNGRFARAQPWDLTDHLDHELIRRAEATIAGGRPIELALPIDNARRAVGTLLSGELARRCGATLARSGS